MPSPQELRDRTRAFAVRIVRLYRSLPYRTDAQVLGKQLIRSGTAVAANYRAACRARSKAEWVAKIGVVVEEADETLFLARNANGLRGRYPRQIAGTYQGRTRTQRDLYSVSPHGAKYLIAINYKLRDYKITNS